MKKVGLNTPAMNNLSKYLHRKNENISQFHSPVQFSPGYLLQMNPKNSMKDMNAFKNIFHP